MKPKETAKRIIALMLALIMAALCTACSGDNGSKPDGGGETDGEGTKAPVNETTKAPDGDMTKAPDAETSDKPTESTGSDVPDEPVVEEKKITLEKCESTGEVGFDKIYLPNHDMIYFTGNASGIFPFSHNGKDGYINEKGEIVLKNQWEKAGVFSEGKAFVQDGDGWHIIDADGNVLFSTEENFCSGHSLIGDDDDISAEFNIPYYINGSAISVLSYVDKSVKLTNSKIFTIDDKFNFNSFDDRELIDIEGRVYYWATKALTGSVRGFIIPIPLSDNDKLVTYNKIYDVSGNLLFSGNNSTYIGDKYVISSDNNIIDISSGDVVFGFEYEKCGVPSDGVIPVCAYDKWGLIDTDGNELIKPKYAYLSSFSHGLGFALDLDGNGLLINKNGETIADLPDEVFGGDDSLSVETFTDSGFIFVSNDSEKGFLINEKGEVIFSGSKDSFKYISAGYVVYGDDLYKVVTE